MAADRRSVFGWAVMCAGEYVYWFSKTQKCIALSITEAKYVALADTIKEATLMRHVWGVCLSGLWCYVNHGFGG